MKKTILLIAGVIAVGMVFVLRFNLIKGTSVKVFQSRSLADNSPTPADSKNKARILFVGDMMFDRWIRQVSERRGASFVFQGTNSLLQGEDLVVGNLEGPITDKASVSVNSEFGSKDNYMFTFPPETAKSIRDENVRLVNIGNNHILNFEDSGLDETENYLNQAGVDYFGDVGKTGNRFFIKDIKGMKIAFVNYNQFARNAEADALSDLRSVGKSHPDFTVVYTHWGTEFRDRPDERDKELAHEFVDNGADLVIGTHPHVIQTKEEYKGKTIYYSLGNFIFDQYFDANTQKGLAVEVEIGPQKSSSFKEYRVEMKNSGQTILD